MNFICRSLIDSLKYAVLKNTKLFTNLLGTEELLRVIYNKGYSRHFMTKKSPIYSTIYSIEKTNLHFFYG